MIIHFSIDDVIETFYWAYQNNPISLFDMNFFGTLKKWHETFGMRVSLYAFGTNSRGFSIEMLQEKYCAELVENAEWIRIGYHGLYYSDIKVINDEKFKGEQEIFKNRFENILSSTIRLHGWTATESEIECSIKTGKVNTFLCPDYFKENVYNLTSEETRQVMKRRGSITSGNARYVSTDYRMDFMKNNDVIYKKIQNNNKEKIYLFLHEWRFKEQAGILEKLWTDLKSRKLEFSFE